MKCIDSSIVIVANEVEIVAVLIHEAVDSVCHIAGVMVQAERVSRQGGVGQELLLHAALKVCMPYNRWSVVHDIQHTRISYLNTVMTNGRRSVEHKVTNIPGAKTCIVDE